MKNLFLTGEKGVGKSTLLKKALDNLDIQIGGYVTERTYEGYYRKYIAKSLYDNKEYTIIKVDTRDYSKEGFEDAFKKGVVSILDRSLKNSDLIVLDELGPAEDNIHEFTSKVFEVLDSDKIVFGVLKDDECGFLNDIKDRDDVVVIRVTKENRDSLSDEIMGILGVFM